MKAQVQIFFVFAVTLQKSNSLVGSFLKPKSSHKPTVLRLHTLWQIYAMLNCNASPKHFSVNFRQQENRDKLGWLGRLDNRLNIQVFTIYFHENHSCIVSSIKSLLNLTACGCVIWSSNSCSNLVYFWTHLWLLFSVKTV